MSNPLDHPSIQHLQELAIRSGEVGLPNAVKEEYDAALIGAGKKLWRGMLAVAASGFGKGVLLAGLAALAVTGMVMGYEAHLAGAAFEKGFTAGLGQAVSFLTHSLGLTWLAIGGAIGAVNDVRRQHNKITAEIARAEEKYYAQEREIQQVNEVMAASGRPWDQVEPNFAEQERQRRAAGQVAGRTVN